SDQKARQHPKRRRATLAAALPKGTANEKGTITGPLFSLLERSACLGAGYGHMLFDHARDSFLAGRTHHAFNFLSVSEQNQSRNSLYSITLRGGGVIVDIYLHDPGGLAKLFGN